MVNNLPVKNQQGRPPKTIEGQILEKESTKETHPCKRKALCRNLVNHIQELSD
jgi:hypothetical protein